MKRASDFLYIRLYKLLKNQIHTGMIKPGEFLLTEAELCKYYNMSRNSVRRALEELQKEGLIVKKAGLGTMVNPHNSASHSGKRQLRIAAPFPAYFADYGLPMIWESFREKHPAIDIKIISYPSATFWESVQQAESMGAGPHLVLVSDSVFAGLDKKNSFMNLESNLEELQEIYPKIRETFRSDGEIPAVPVTFTPICLTYNPDLFKQNHIPLPDSNWTADQFFDAAKRLTSVQDGKISRFGFSIHPTFSRWLVFALQNGMQPNHNRNRSIMTESLAYLQSLLHKERIATIYTDVWNMSNPYIYGKAAMSLTTLFEMSSWSDRGIGFAPQIASLPFGDTNSTVMQANLLMVPKSSSELDLSLLFLKTALETEVQRRICKNTPFLSVKYAVNNEEKTPDYLRALNIGNGLIELNYFVHELIDSANQEESRIDFSLFWLGLEEAANVAEHF